MNQTLQLQNKNLGRPFREILGLLLVVAAVMAFFWGFLPLKDWSHYFNFADQRKLFDIPNTLDVLSNLGFLLAGLLGLIWAKTCRLPGVHRVLGAGMALGSLLTFFGSSYFHLNPNPGSLLWDRLSMTLVFASLVGLLIADRIDRPSGFWSAIVLVGIGILVNVGFAKDWFSLRPYILFQYGSILYLLVLVCLQPKGLIANSLIFKVAILYLAAKVFEVLDAPVFELLGFVSGHTLKHLFAGAAVYKTLTFLKGE